MRSPPHPRRVTNNDIIEHILPAGEVSILAGSSGAGKSTLIMQALKAFENGEDTWLGKKLNYDARWGYLANDHAWKLYEETANRVQLSLNDMPHISLMDDESIDLEKFRTSPLLLLEELLSRLVDHGCNAIVVDTLVSWFGGDIRNYNLPAYALLRLGRWCRKHQATLLGMHHATKARTDYTFKRAQDRISGSMALLGFSSTQLCLLPPDETGEAASQFHVIAHNAPPLVIPLKKTEQGIFIPFDVGDEPLSPIEESMLRFIGEQGEGAVVSRNSIAEALRGTSAATIDRNLKKLVAAGRLTKVRHGEYTIAKA